MCDSTRLPMAECAKNPSDRSPHLRPIDARETACSDNPDLPPSQSLPQQTEKAYQKQFGVNVGYVSSRRVIS